MPKRDAKRPPAVESTARERALDALSQARREGYSLRTAARNARTNVATVLRHTGQAWTLAGDRYVPTEYDRIARPMNILTPAGPVAVVVRDSRVASFLGNHGNAVRAYTDWGDEAELERFRGRYVRVGGRRYELAADPVQLDRLAAGHELHYELYRH